MSIDYIVSPQEADGFRAHAGDSLIPADVGTLHGQKDMRRILGIAKGLSEVARQGYWPEGIFDPHDPECGAAIRLLEAFKINRDRQLDNSVGTVEPSA